MSIFTFRFAVVAGFIIFICIPGFYTLTNAAQGDTVKGLEISRVRVTPQRFNPVKGEVTTISYNLSKQATSIIKIFDPERRLVRDLIPEDTGDPGSRSVIWDGRDMDGKIVPDEAYIFTVEITDYRGNFNYYDPTTFSGGEYFEPAVEFKEQNKTVNYHLDRDARVRIRAGIQGGPLLKAITNWTPRLAGNKEEKWDGMDESGNLMAVRQNKFKLTAEAVTLPENAILTIGNERDTYYRYLNEISYERPTKVDRPFYKSKSTLPGYQYGDIVDYGIKLKAYLRLSKPVKTNKRGLPILDGKVSIKIFLDEDIERFAIEQRYEILYFVDFNFVMEKEEGYSPSTWIWNTTVLPEGEHVLTVNIATLTGQFTSASLKAFIQKERN